MSHLVKRTGRPCSAFEEKKLEAFVELKGTNDVQLKELSRLVGALRHAQECPLKEIE